MTGTVWLTFYMVFLILLFKYTPVELVETDSTEERSFIDLMPKYLFKRAIIR